MVRAGHQHTDPDGSVSAEYASVLVLAAAVVAAVLLLPIGPLVTDWFEHATCLLSGARCQVSDHRGPAASAEPDRCSRSVSSALDDARASAVIVDIAAVEGYEVAERSDGTVTVTYAVDGSLGASLSAGTYGRVDLGERSLTIGGVASVGTHLGAASGTTWTFDSSEHARAWLEWHRRIEAARDRHDTPLALRWHDPLRWGRRNSLAARADDAVVRLGNRLARRFGRGLERPSEPVRTHEVTRGRWGADAVARAGLTLAEVDARLQGASQLGQVTDLASGETTFLYELDAEVAARLAASSGVAPTAAVASGGRVGVTVDAGGTPTELEIHTTFAGAAGLDPTQLVRPRDVLAPAAAGGDGDSVYELTMRMAIEPGRDTSAVLDALGRGAIAVAAGGRAGSLVEELWARGQVGLVEREVVGSRHGVELTSTAGPVSGAVGGGRSHSTSTAVRAYFLDHPDAGGNRGWEQWTTCVVG